MSGPSWARAGAATKNVRITATTAATPAAGLGVGEPSGDLVISQYATGSTNSVSTIDRSRPKQVTAPIGPHSVEPLVMSGTTPTAAAADVRKIGRIRRLPAAIAASRTLIPPWCSSSA